jgi:hypothetical protein
MSESKNVSSWLEMFFLAKGYFVEEVLMTYSSVSRVKIEAMFLIRRWILSSQISSFSSYPRQCAYLRRAVHQLRVEN